MYKIPIMLLILGIGSVPIMILCATVINVDPMRVLVVSYAAEPRYKSVYPNEKELMSLISDLRGESWVETAGPFHSPTHWNHHIRSHFLGDLDVYTRNHLKVDLEMEQRELGEDITVVYENYKPGDILIKSHYQNEKDLEANLLTVMVKEFPGYDKQADDWRYMEIQDGVTILNGNSRDAAVRDRCVNCHSGVSYRHYVFHNYMHESLKLGKTIGDHQ